MSFEKISDGIHKMNIPYQDGFTSVFALENGGRWILADFGASDSDGEKYIIPAVRQIGFVPEILLCSHIHEDHSGGIKIIANEFPNAVISAYPKYFKLDGASVHYVSDGEILLDRYKVVDMRGHTGDSIGILDTQNAVLLTFDALQGYGIEAYGANVDNAEEYVKTLKRVSKMSLNGIIASHEFEPFGSTAFGREAVEKYISASMSEFERIIRIAEENAGMTAEEITSLCNAGREKLLVGTWTVKSVMEYAEKKKRR